MARSPARTACLCALAAAALSIPFAVPTTARAEPDAKALSRARAKFQQATELEQAGNWSQALVLFREVGQVRMTPQVRFHIALCEENLGKLAAALGGYELARADADQVPAESFKREVAAKVEELRTRIPKLVVRRGQGAEAATISLDGVALGSSSVGVEVPVDPGPHTVSAKAPGHEAFTSTVTVEERQTQTIDVTLARAAHEPAHAAPPPPVADTAPAKEGSNVVPYVIGGVGAASLVASGVFFYLKTRAIGDLDDACGPDRNRCPKSSEPTYDDAKTYNVVSGVTLGVGVVAVGVAATLLLTGSAETAPAEEAGLSVRLGAPGAGPGATLAGTF